MSNDSSFNFRLESIQEDLRRFALSLARDEEGAKELVQNTCVKALLSRKSFDDSKSIKPWAFTVMRSTFADSKRSAHARASFVTLDDPTQPVHFYALQTVDFFVEDYKPCLECVRKALPDLAPQYRLVIETLMENADSTFESLATLIGMPFGTFKSHMRLARRQLRALGIDLFSDLAPSSF